MALTTIMVGFAYMGYNQTQKLLFQFREQNDFFSQVVDLKNRLNVLSTSATSILFENDSKYLVTCDSSVYKLQFSDRYITIEKSGVTDTFKLKPLNVRSEFEAIKDFNKSHLIKNIDFDVLYEKEVFHIDLHKTYDAYSKLLIEIQNSN